MYIPYPDAPGSENIILSALSENAPKFAGLWWVDRGVDKPVSLNVWEDGTVEVGREGVRAQDDDDNWWVSKKVGGEIDAIVMVRDSND